MKWLSVQLLRAKCTFLLLLIWKELRHKAPKSQSEKVNTEKCPVNMKHRDVICHRKWSETCWKVIFSGQVVVLIFFHF